MSASRRRRREHVRALRLRVMAAEELAAAAWRALGAQCEVNRKMLRVVEMDDARYHRLQKRVAELEEHRGPWPGYPLPHVPTSPHETN